MVIARGLCRSGSAATRPMPRKRSRQSRSYNFLENQRRQRTMTRPTADLFESLIGQDLKVAAVNGAEPWLVVGVTRRAEHALRSDQPFDVALLAPASNDRQQGTRACVMPNGETFQFFAVPIAATATGVSFELVFN